MRHEFYDLKNPEVRAKYYKPTDGRPSYELIIKTIRKRVMVLREHHKPHFAYISEQLCFEIWDKFPNQHQYIGHCIKDLIAEGLLPMIRRVGETKTGLALYSINQ